MRALRVNSPQNSSATTAAVASTAAMVNTWYERRGASSTVPRYCVWRSASTSGRNSGTLTAVPGDATSSVRSIAVSRWGRSFSSTAISPDGLDGSMMESHLLGHEEILDLEIHFNVSHALVHRQYLADSAVEKILEQGWARGFEIEFSALGNVPFNRDSQLVDARGRLDDAGHMGNP